MIISRLNDDVYLSTVNLAGTHDSATAYVGMEKMCRCQNLTVEEQLNIGVRLFDIRLYNKGGEFYLCHAIADCFEDEAKTKKLTFGTLLDLFCSFLRDNPQESLVLSIKLDRGIQNKAFFSAFYNKYIKGNEDKWYLENKNPTLSECRGKLVLMRRCKRRISFLRRENCGLDFSFWRDQKSKRSVHPLALRRPVSFSAMIQDRYTLSYEKKWESCAKPFLDSCRTSKTDFAVHFISTAYRDKGADLKKGADQINEKFMDYPLGKNKGWILVDFADEKIISKIMNSNTEETT